MSIPKVNPKPPVSPPFDSENDRPAELDELNFSDDQEESFADLVPESEVIVGDTQNRDTDPAMPGDEPNLNDLSPETLIEEDGARSSHEKSKNIPADKELKIVKEDEIGAGYGLDEAELAHTKPLDRTQN